MSGVNTNFAASAAPYHHVLAADRREPRERTDQPVWRGSYDADDDRAQVVLPFAGRPRHQVFTFISWFVLGLKELANETKLAGKAHQLTHNAIAVAETLLRRCTDYETGRCTPSIETIMEKTRFSRPTVIHLLAQLRKLAGIDWVRRTVRTGRTSPAVEQTSNAYFINFEELPRRLLMYLRQKLDGVFDFDALPRQKGSPPLPAWKDRQTARLVARVVSGSFAGGKTLAQELADRARQISAASPTDRARVLWPDDPEAQRFFEESTTARPTTSASSDSRLQWGTYQEIQKE